MAIAARYAVPTAAILVVCGALTGLRLMAREPRDPCEATPEIHACAMFLKPDWMIRRAQAGRMAPTPPVIARVDARTDPEPVTITGSIAVSDRLAIVPAAEAETGLSGL